MARDRGVYVWRTRKPGAFVGWPIIGRHFGYVGKTNNYKRREREHLLGTRTLRPQPWCDLEPKCYRPWLPFTSWEWGRTLWEAILIRLLMPVYNDSMNRGNPRRISLDRAAAQRRLRDKHGLKYKIVRAIIVWPLKLGALALMVWFVWEVWIR